MAFLFKREKFIDYLKEKGLKKWDVDLGTHYYDLLVEQLMAIVPISILLIGAMLIFFGKGVTSPPAMLFGLICAIIGLTLFVDSLRVCIMPMSDQLGVELPRVLSLPAILGVAFVLGVLVTYAEPAIASLAPLAKLVDPEKAPYLYCALLENKETTVLMVGVGVGFAAMLGTMRFVKGWKMLPLIWSTLIPAVLAACYMWWGDPNLRPLLGLAWDCGAVTTGPVTVPVLIALGIGVMKTVNEQKGSAAAKSENALEGFGIVTLASLLPVLMVQLFGIYLTFTYTIEDVMANIPPPTTTVSIFDTSPVKELTNALRAVLPLFIVLTLLVKFVLKRPLPFFTFYLKQEAEPSAVEASRPAAVDAGNFEGLDLTIFDDKSAGAEGEAQSRASEEPTVSTGSSPPSSGDRSRDATSAAASMRDFKPQWSSQTTMGLGLLEAIGGMTLFNLGLGFGFSSIGDQVGQLLPAAFLATAEEPGSPYYPYGVGVMIALGVLFFLGFLATRAEPALNVLGGIVEDLSKGSFSKFMLVYAVCAGVSMGMAVGVTKILFGAPLIWFILIKYAVALALSQYSTEDFICIAWDSAGVTTGPVTVPFVLATGVGCSKAVLAPEGFGILTCASVWPICSVLSMDLIRRYVLKPKAKAPAADPA